MLIKAIVGKGNYMKANTWQGALLKAFAVQLGLVGFLSLGWFGFVGGFGGADNPRGSILARFCNFLRRYSLRPCWDSLRRPFLCHQDEALLKRRVSWARVNGNGGPR
jgi:hypothetical protein